MTEYCYDRTPLLGGARKLLPNMLINAIYLHYGIQMDEEPAQDAPQKLGTSSGAGASAEQGTSNAGVSTELQDAAQGSVDQHVDKGTTEASSVPRAQSQGPQSTDTIRMLQGTYGRLAAEHHALSSTSAAGHENMGHEVSGAAAAHVEERGAQARSSVTRTIHNAYVKLSAALKKFKKYATGLKKLVKKVTNALKIFQDNVQRYLGPLLAFLNPVISFFSRVLTFFGKHFESFMELAEKHKLQHHLKILISFVQILGSFATFQVCFMVLCHVSARFGNEISIVPACAG